MRRWEYMSHTVRYSEAASLVAFNILGAQGWELCGFADGLAWFKRDVIARDLAIQGGAQGSGDLAELAVLAEGKR